MSNTPITSPTIPTRGRRPGIVRSARIAALFACALALAGTKADAQLSVMQKPATVYGAFHGEGQSVGATNVTVYTVPAGRRARLTDIVVSAREAGTGLCYFQLTGSTNSTRTYEIVVAPASTLHIPLNTGYQFEEGEQIIMSRSNRISAQCNEYLFFSVSGYLFVSATPRETP
jgi:hypothetical protein